jgi:hypothetical protein
MKLSYRFPLFSSIITVILSFFWLSNISQPISSIIKFSPILPKKEMRALLPVTAAGEMPYKDMIPDNAELLSRYFYPSLDGKDEEAIVFYHSEGLQYFIGQIAQDENNDLAGVYVDDVLALPVVQQPKGDNLYVSRLMGNVTQFQSAASHGVTGLLAHNYLSGDLFYGMELGQVVNLIYGDGRVKHYIIDDIQSYEKLEGDFYTSNYMNLETGEVLTTPDLFQLMYTGDDKVTFQTCIKNGSDWSWGRIFIVAIPHHQAASGQ